MTDNVDSFCMIRFAKAKQTNVLEHLRALRNDVKAQREEIRQGFRDVSTRIERLETRLDLAS